MTTTSGAPRRTLELLDDCIDRGRPMAAAHAATGTRVVSADRGRIAVSVTVAADDITGPLLVACDAALGGAVTSAFDTEGKVATLQLTVQFFTGYIAAGPLLASAEALFADDTVGASAGQVVDAAGRVVATMSTRCARMPARTGPAPKPAGGAAPVALSYENATPMAAALALSIARLAGTAQVRATAHPALANLGGMVQGGALAAVAATGMERLWPAPAEHGYCLTVDYVRSIPADGRSFRAEAAIEHNGRSLQLATATVFDARGRAAVRARMNGFRAGDPAAK